MYIIIIITIIVLRAVLNGYRAGLNKTFNIVTVRCSPIFMLKGA